MPRSYPKGFTIKSLIIPNKIEFFRLENQGKYTQIFFFISLPFPSALTPNKFRTAGAQKGRRLDSIFLPADRGIEPGTAG